MKKFQRKNRRLLYLVSCGLILALISTIPIRLAIAYYHSPAPQAILTLGGGNDREEFTAHFAQVHPGLKIWVSTGILPEKSRAIFQGAGIPEERVHIDRRAVDTVTNFTSLVKNFKQEQIQHVYLITSSFHMRRAKAIAIFVLGSQGITFTAVSVPSKQPPETWVHTLRDVGRSLLWIFTGRTGASLNLRLESLASRPNKIHKFTVSLEHLRSVVVHEEP